MPERRSFWIFGVAWIAGFGSAHAADPPTSANGAVGAALGAPAAPKVTATPAAPTATQGVGENAKSGATSDLAQALRTHDAFRAAQLGATSADIIRMKQAEGLLPDTDAETATITIAPDGSIARRSLILFDGPPLASDPVGAGAASPSPGAGSVDRDQLARELLQRGPPEGPGVVASETEPFGLRRINLRSGPPGSITLRPGAPAEVVP